LIARCLHEGGMTPEDCYDAALGIGGDDWHTKTSQLRVQDCYGDIATAQTWAAKGAARRVRQHINWETQVPRLLKVALGEEPEATPGPVEESEATQ